jgi:sulfite reductase alpha subunit-like flavoprotein
MDLLTLIAASVIAITLYFLVQRFTTPTHSSQSSSAYSAKSKDSDKGKEKEKKEEDAKVPLKIYFGSQTGTAEEFANSLADEAVAYGFAPEVHEISFD